MKINVIFLFSILFLFACGKNDDTRPRNDSDIPSGTFSAKINGELFDSPSSATALLSNLDTTVFNSTMFQLNGVDIFTAGVFKNLIILFNKEDLDLSESTYSIEGECNPTALCPILIYAEQNDTENFSAASNSNGGDFTITFSELDFRVGGKVVGTFSAKLYDDFGENYQEVTEGKFNLPIQ